MLMTQILDEQISKLDLEVYKTDQGYYIPKQEKIELKFEPNHFYLIELSQADVAKELLHNAALNWNRGVEIKSSFLKCEYLKTLGNMVCLNASGYDPDHDIDLPDIYLNIWVNYNIIKILKEI